MRRILSVILLFHFLFLCGCSEKPTLQRDGWDPDKFQTYWMQGSAFSFAQAGQDGYYFLKRSKLFYYDSSEEVVLPVCNKPECRHDDIDCNADLPGSPLQTIMMGKDGLYTVVLEDDGVVLQENLYRIDRNGNGFERITTLQETALLKEGGTKSTFGSGCIDHGVLYYTVYNWKEDGDRLISLWRVPVEKDGKSELILEDTTADSNFIGFMTVYDGKIYCIQMEYEGETYEKTMKRIVSIDPTDKAVETVLEEAPFSYFISNGILYYTLEESPGIFTYDLETKERGVMAEDVIDPGIRMYWDGEHMIGYADVKQWENAEAKTDIYVLDKSGGTVDIFSVDCGRDWFSIYGGDKDVLIARRDNEIIALSKDQFGKSSKQWSVWK